MAIPLPEQSKAVQSLNNVTQYNLTVEELTEFMVKYGFSDQEFANLLGMTIQGVRLWKREQRVINMTVTKLVRLFIKFPHLIKVY